jgi:hypothetical protein
MRRPRSLLLAIVVATLSTTATARAQERDDKAKCLASYEQAQRLRKQALLRASMRELAICSRDLCPALIRSECVRWMDEANAALPTVVLTVLGPDGKEVTDASVKIDDDPVSADVPGMALPIDPGLHVVRFERGAASVEQKIVVHEGEKRRKVEASFPAPPPKPAPDPSSSSRAPGPLQEPVPAGSSRPVPTLAVVFGGAGLLALGGFSLFAIKGASDKSDLDGCKPFCSQEAIDSNKRTFLVADIFLGTAVVTLGVATVLFLTRGRGTNVR